MIEFVTLKALTIVFALGLIAGCGEAAIVDSEAGFGSGSGAKNDSGWLGTDSYEVAAVVRGTVMQSATGDWADIATDANLQSRLIDQQLKFVKTTAESHGWRLNQLADTVQVRSVYDTGAGIQIEYEAVIDMLGRFNGSLPRLSELDPRVFAAVVPVAPTNVTYQEMNACAEADGGHSIRDYNFHYYFKPGKADCELAVNESEVEITQVFERPNTYPEYDQLLQVLDGNTLGFATALVPNRGDNDPASRFDAHAKMLENELNLTGVELEDGKFRRYTWIENGVGIIIDLYDPTKLDWSSSFAKRFRDRLSQYTFVHYNGHSSYGSKHLLDDPNSYTDAYQIISMHSCQSYAYYTRQVFRGKATANDPSGFAGADVVATGKSSYPSGSPPTVRVLLTSLMKGIQATKSGNRSAAPSWLEITEQISNATWGDILYGIAGVRTNVWRP